MIPNPGHLYESDITTDVFSGTILSVISEGFPPPMSGSSSLLTIFDFQLRDLASSPTVTPASASKAPHMETRY